MVTEITYMVTIYLKKTTFYLKEMLRNKMVKRCPFNRKVRCGENIKLYSAMLRNELLPEKCKVCPYGRAQQTLTEKINEERAWDDRMLHAE